MTDKKEEFCPSWELGVLKEGGAMEKSEAEPAALQGYPALDSSKRDAGLPGLITGEPENSQENLTLGHMVTMISPLQQRDGCDRTEIPKNRPTQIGSIDSGQRCQDHSIGKNYLSARIIWTFMCNKIKQNPQNFYLTPHTKINLKQIINLNKTSIRNRR